MFKQIIRYGVMASTVRSHRADRGSIPRIGVKIFFRGASVQYFLRPRNDRKLGKKGRVRARNWDAIELKLRWLRQLLLKFDTLSLLAP